jgi:hypothetical protein
MALRLVVEIGGNSLSHFEYLLEGGQVTLGRNPSCLVQIPLDSVSDKHLSFVREGTSWLVADRGSTNGTRLNGELMEPDRFRPLVPGDRLRIVDIVIRVDTGAAGEATSAQRSGTLARRMIEDLVARSASEEGQVYLEVLSGRDVGQKRVLAALQTTRVVGPSDTEASGWRLSDPGVLSPLFIEPVGSGFELSGADVLLNGEPLPEQGAALVSGARIAVGNTILLFFDPLASRLSAEMARVPPRPSPTRPRLSTSLGGAPGETVRVVRLNREEVVRTAAGLPLQGDRDQELAQAGPSSEEIDLDARREAWGAVELGLLGLAVVLFLGAVGVFLLLFGYF